MRRPPAKRRGPTATPHTQPADDTDTRGYSAPGHLGGTFDHAGYEDQRWDGYFGFAPKPDWPVDRRREARA